MRRPLIGIWLLLLAAFALELGVPVLAEAASDKYGWRFNQRPYLRMNVDLSYRNRWGDAGSGDSFSQTYSFVQGGNVIDPRLMSYEANLKLAHQLNSGLYGEDFWMGYLEVRASFFNRINRNRGLKLWKYVPSPAILKYSTNYNSDYINHTVELGMYYFTPAYITFFHGDQYFKFVQDYNALSKLGRGNTNNRYRVKYTGAEFNYNRNGNGNWNRNGNGNWNRNGNGNWNRNGNGNWNRNGNGNWNRNGNGNWNRNGNGNWNRNGNGNWNQNSSGNGNGNWNANANANQNANQAPKLYLKFPELSLDVARAQWNWRLGGIPDSTVYQVSLRAVSENNERSRGEMKYRSRYLFMYYFTKYDSDAGVSLASEKLTLNAENSWEHFSTSAQASRQDAKGDVVVELAARMAYDNHYRNYVDYNVGIYGNYTKTDTWSRYRYGGDLALGTALSKRRKLAPKITSQTNFHVNYAASGSRNSTSDEMVTRDRYSATLTENLNFRNVENMVFDVRMRLGLTAETLPYSAMLMGRTYGLRNFQATSSYSFSSLKALEGNGVEARSHGLNLQWNYSFLGIFQLMNSNMYAVTQYPDGRPDAERTQVEGSVSWVVTAFISTSATGKLIREDEISNYETSANLRMRQFYYGTLLMTVTSRWDDRSDGRDTETRLLYDWPYRQFNFYMEYTNTKARSGTVNNLLLVRLSRSFNIGRGR